MNSLTKGNNMEECNHYFGLTNNHDGVRKFVTNKYKGDEWRGTIFMFCPNCGKKLWENKEFTDGKGKYIRLVQIKEVL